MVLALSPFSKRCHLGQFFYANFQDKTRGKMQVPTQTQPEQVTGIINQQLQTGGGGDDNKTGFAIL